MHLMLKTDHCSQEQVELTHKKYLDFVTSETTILDAAAATKLTRLELPTSGTSYSVAYTIVGTGFANITGGATTHTGNSIAIPADDTTAYTTGSFKLLPTAVTGAALILEFKFYSQAAETAVSGLTATATRTFTYYVPGFDDVIDLGGQSFATQTAFGNDVYNLINLSISATGPNTTTFPKVDATRVAIRKAPQSHGLAIYERSAMSGVQAALVLQLQAEKARSFNAFNSSNGFVYKLDTTAVPTVAPAVLGGSPTQITSTTPAGNYQLTVRVDDLVRTITIVVKNPAPKVSVLSVTEAADTTVNSVAVRLLNNYVVNAGLPNLPAASRFSFGTAANSRLRIRVGSGALGTNPTALDVADLATSFLAPVSSAYTIPLSMVTPTNLYGYIGVADLALGSHSYSISKKYPDGRVLTFSDVATVTAHDDNGLAIFGTVANDSIKTAANTSFLNNWIMNETAVAKGTYEFNFTIASATTKIVVNVVENIGLDITSVSIANQELLSFGNGYLTQLGSALGNLSIEFDLNMVTANDYLRVLSYTPSKNNGWDIALPNQISSSNYYKLSDLNGVLNLGKLESNFNDQANGAGHAAGGAAASLDSMVIVIEIYRLVPFSSLTGTSFVPFGKLSLVSTQSLKLRIDAFA